MLDRVRFGAYLPFAVVSAGVIYPVVAHWQWGGGWLVQQGFQDFAGSGIVHVCGATAAFAGAIVVGPRIGKFREDGRPVPIPGHSMPLAILGVLILWVGWQGFNAGSWLGAVGQDLGRVIVVTNLAGVFGVIGATAVAYLLLGTVDIAMIGNGAVAGLGAIAGPCGFVAPWGGAVIGLIAGSVMVLRVLGVDRIGVDDPIGAVAGHGGGGTVGVLAPGFLAISRTVGLRSLEVAEVQGLDIVEHGMYGYPERFIEVLGATPDDPVSAFVAPSAPTVASSSSPGGQTP